MAINVKIKQKQCEDNVENEVEHIIHRTIVKYNVRL